MSALKPGSRILCGAGKALLSLMALFLSRTWSATCDGLSDKALSYLNKFMKPSSHAEPFQAGQGELNIT